MERRERSLTNVNQLYNPEVQPEPEVLNTAFAQESEMENTVQEFVLEPNTMMDLRKRFGHVRLDDSINFFRD